MADIITGLMCPNCAGRLEIREGQRIVQCPYCEARSLVRGDSGVSRYQVARQVDRPTAEKAVRAFWNGINKAMDLSSRAQITELFLVYLPYWRVLAQMAGWLFGQKSVGSGKNRRLEPREVKIMENREWTGAAAEVAEFGVEHINLAGLQLAAYNPDHLHTEGLVFEPTGAQTHAQVIAHHVWTRSVQTKLSRVSQTWLKFLHETLALVYYPLWVARYTYRQRVYQVVVDGAAGRVLYGKAPGNVFYRATMLMAGTALGSFILINGEALALYFLGNSSGRKDEGALVLLAIPFVVGVLLIVGGFRAFRWGEEIEHREKVPGSQPAAGQFSIDAGAENLLDQVKQYLEH